LLYQLLLGGNGTSIRVLGSHHGTSSVAHLIHNATVRVQLQF
jgi:glycerol dehydrogenase-like iron-containing ADH family enzyme